MHRRAPPASLQSLYRTPALISIYHAHSRRYIFGIACFATR
jgi:hypothetical protein